MESESECNNVDADEDIAAGGGIRGVFVVSRSDERGEDEKMEEIQVRSLDRGVVLCPRVAALCIQRLFHNSVQVKGPRRGHKYIPNLRGRE